MDTQALIFLTAVLGLGIAAQWIAWRIKLPSILLLLGIGFVVGMTCGDNPNFVGENITDEVIPGHLLFPVVSIAVAIIMFEGGLTLQLHELENSGRIVLRIVSIGVVVSWILTTVACHYLIGMHLRVAALTGAILVVTGPTVIGPLLRHVRPSRRVGSILKWEGIVIDPIGAILAVLTYEALINEGGPMAVCVELIKIVVIGLTIGTAAALLMVWLLRRYLIPDFLHNPAFLAAAIGTFTVSNLLAHEAGLVTVTVFGIALANQKIVPVRHVIEFKENLRVLLISCLFIVLAARIQLTDIAEIGFGGGAFLILLIFVVRPAAIFVSTIGTDLTKRERVFLAFLAPRGIVAAAVSSVFALEVAEHFHEADQLAGAGKIVPVTFLVIVGTVMFYGLTAAPIARKLGLAVANAQGLLFAGATPWVREIAKVLQEEGFEVMLVDTNYANTSAARMEGLPCRCASIVSEYMEELDLGGIGQLMAMTPNDDLNRLAVVEFESVFERAAVFQLAPGGTESKRRDTSAHMKGRYLFDAHANFEALNARFSDGATIKKTKVTEEYSYEDFLDTHGEDTLLMFVISENRELNVITVDEPVSPQAGQTIVAMVSS